MLRPSGSAERGIIDVSCHEVCPPGAEGTPDRQLPGDSVSVGGLHSIESPELGMATARPIAAAGIVIGGTGGNVFAKLA